MICLVRHMPRSRGAASLEAMAAAAVETWEVVCWNYRGFLDRDRAALRGKPVDQDPFD